MNRIVNLTNINRDIADNRNIKYIVIHYVGAVSTALNNSNYFKDVYRGASAHYFVDENDCVQVVEDKDVSWHCNTTGTYKNTDCRNLNSIGIEMCCKNNGVWYFEQATVNNTVELVKELMAKYNIPVENVIRHYDVTGKICPAPYVNDDKWNEFKNMLGQVEEVEEVEDIEIMEELRRQISDLTNRVAKLEGQPAVVNNVKSIEQIAREVIDGKWGNNPDRKNKLANAGYDYNAVQNRVNEIL